MAKSTAMARTEGPAGGPMAVPGAAAPRQNVQAHPLQPRHPAPVGDALPVDRWTGPSLETEGPSAPAPAKATGRCLDSLSAGALAHEFRNWLTVLRVHCDLLAQPGLVENSHRAWLEDLSEAIDRGGRLLAPLLAALTPAPMDGQQAHPRPLAMAANVPAYNGPLLEGKARTMLSKPILPEDEGTSLTSQMPGALRLLVVDDDAPVRSGAAEIARRRGLVVHTAEDAPSARAALAAHMADILLLDLKLPGGGGLALLDEVRTLSPETVVVVMTAYATVPSAVEAMRSGASEYLTKPFTMEELDAALERAAERHHFDQEGRRLREQLRTPEGLGGLIGRSPEMERVYRILSKVTASRHPVLILGESGTGKEMVARAIHFNGPHANLPFVPVDCGSLAPSLIESELFGHVKGAFTGATHSKEGLLVSAGGGTVFLDEIGELPMDLQAKLLRALQEKEVRPVGSNQRVPIQARVLAATNRDLPQMVEQGRFRKDLYFRLNVVNVKLPPLRERRQDIPLLAAHFLDRMRRETGREHTLSDEVLHLMRSYDWPGNVRELENMLERACTLSSGPLLHVGDLPTQLQEHHRQQRGPAPGATPRTGLGADAPSGVMTMAEMEKQAILNTLQQLNGDKLMAAKLLGIGKTTLYRKLKEYGLSEMDQ